MCVNPIIFKYANHKLNKLGDVYLFNTCGYCENCLESKRNYTYRFSEKWVKLKE